MDNLIESPQMKKLKERIPYNEKMHKNLTNYQQIIKDLLEDSENIGLSLKYPMEDYSLLELPSRYYNWQLRCCLELYKLAGTSNIQSYSENNLSWTMFRNGLSEDLISEIVPDIYVSKKDDLNV